MRHLHRPFLRLAALTALLTASAAPYVVEAGDTLSSIARAHGTTVAAIVAENDLPDADRIAAGQQLRLPAAPAPSTEQAEVGRLLHEVATEHGWSPAFVKAVAWQESGWNNHAVSSAGAVGIMQVMPATGRFVSKELVGRDLDLQDPRDNVLAGVAFLQHLWELTGGDVELTLAGYYQGLRSVADHGRYQHTERYVANVLALRDRFR